MSIDCLCGRALEDCGDCTPDYVRDLLTEVYNGGTREKYYIVNIMRDSRFEPSVQRVIEAWRLADCGSYKQSRDLLQDIPKDIKGLVVKEANRRLEDCHSI